MLLKKLYDKKKLLLLLTFINFSPLISAANIIDVFNNEITEANDVAYQKYKAERKKFISYEQWQFNNFRLLKAAFSGNLEVANELLSLAEVDINCQDKNLVTPLIAASSENHLEIVELLIKYKANLNLTNKLGWTALMFAASKGFTKIVQLLIQAKADIYAKDISGNTAFHYANLFCRLDVLLLLHPGLKCCKNCTIL